MDAFDAMGPRPDRRHAFTGALLSYEDDTELVEIVEQAARELEVPVAMVTLVLDHIQRFRAAYGLSGELADAAATPRDVSFCQIVASEGRPLEVTDASEDPRVPRFMVETYGLRAYLGMPVVANDVVVGALCVHSNEPRTFTEAERDKLKRLSERVNARLAELASRSEAPERSLREQSTVPAISQLRSTFVPIAAATRSGLLAIEGIRPLFRLANRLTRGEEVEPAFLAQTLQVAGDAIRDTEDALCEVEASLGDAADALKALELLFVVDDRPSLQSVVLAGRELSRVHTARIGGVFLPDDEDRFVTTPQPLAVTLVSAALSMIAQASEGATGGLRADIVDVGLDAGLRISGPRVPSGVWARVADRLGPHVAAIPTARVSFDDDALWLRFVGAGPPA